MRSFNMQHYFQHELYLQKCDSPQCLHILLRSSALLWELVRAEQHVCVLSPCRCAVGNDWWHYGDRCQFKSSAQNNTITAVLASVIVFVVMLIVTVVSVVCVKRKNRRKVQLAGEGITMKNMYTSKAWGMWCVQDLFTSRMKTIEITMMISTLAGNIVHYKRALQLSSFALNAQAL